MVLPPSPSTPPVPGAPVTLPAANALVMMPLLNPTSPPRGAVGADEDIPGRNRKGDRAEILADQAARGHVLARRVAGAAILAALATPAVAITSPIAKEPMMPNPAS